MTSEGERERRKLAGRAGIVGLGTLVSRVLGLGRDMALAAIFGRGETDAFFVAFTIPNALRSLLAEGAVTSAVVPVLSAKLATDGEDAAKDFFAKIRGLSLVALTITTVLGVAFAGPLCELFAGGYHARAGAFERTVMLTRILFPYIFFMGTAALGMAALNAKKKFAVAAFAPGLLNVSFLVCAFLLPGPLERAGMDRAWAMGIGALVGGVLQVAAQIPALRAIGFASAPRLSLDPAVRDALRRLVPIMVGVGIYQVDLVISRRFLSELPQGSQSYFSWAARLSDFPQGIFVMALSTAALPSLATFAAKKEWGELRKTYAHGMRLAMFVAIPCSAALAILGEPIVRAFFERGEFDAVASHETAKALLWQGGAIWTVAAVRQLVPVYYALGDTRTPVVVVSAIDLVAFIVLAVGLRGSMGQAGISAAIAGSSAVQMLLLFVFARGKLGGLELGEIGGSVLRTLVASIIAAVAAYSVARLCGVSSHVIPGLAAIATFGVLFAAVAWAVRSPELEEITSALRRRLGRGKVAA